MGKIERVFEEVEEMKEILICGRLVGMGMRGVVGMVVGRRIRRGMSDMKGEGVGMGKGKF